MENIKQNYEYYKELQEARGDFNYVYNKAYYDYCVSTGVAAVSKTKFGRDVGRLGFSKSKSNGQVVYRGISLEEGVSNEECPQQ